LAALSVNAIEIIFLWVCSSMVHKKFMRNDFKYSLTDLGTLVVEQTHDGLLLANDLTEILTQIFREIEPDRVKQIIYRNFLFQWDAITVAIEYVPIVTSVKIVPLNQESSETAERIAIKNEHRAF
jgi:hypothetical protein